jgi:hypothetical protein
MKLPFQTRTLVLSCLWTALLFLSPRALAETSGPEPRAEYEVSGLLLAFEGQDFRITLPEEEIPKVRVFALREPNRIIFDLLGFEILGSASFPVPSSDFVSSVRVGKHKGETRVVYDLLSENIPHYSWNTQGSTIVLKVLAEELEEETSSGALSQKLSQPKLFSAEKIDFSEPQAPLILSSLIKPSSSSDENNKDKTLDKNFLEQIRFGFVDQNTNIPVLLLLFALEPDFQLLKHLLYFPL